MQLILVGKERKTTKTKKPFYELLFEYPDGSKQVRYWVWSFLHNDINQLTQVWEAAEQSKIGTLYNLQFRKAFISNRSQFIVTVLEDANKPIAYLNTQQNDRTRV